MKKYLIVALLGPLYWQAVPMTLPAYRFMTRKAA